MAATVLIVEDEPQLRELVRISLAGDYRFVEAASVAEADEALLRTAPDLALVDLMLPGGSGLDVVRAVLRARGPIPVVVVSAWATDDYRAAATDAGAVSFVAKPFVPNELSELVAGLLREAGAG